MKRAERKKSRPGTTSRSIGIDPSSADFAGSAPRKSNAEAKPASRSTTLPRPLTSRQNEVLSFINSFLEEWGIPPTLREIGKAMGIKSTNGVSDHLKALERKSYIVRDSAKSRGLRTSDGLRLTMVPLLGDVAAGSPALAVETKAATIGIDRNLIGTHGSDSRREVFALRVVGDSMIEDGIFDGDFVFVHRQKTFTNGSTIVAMIDGEATVKRFFRRGEEICLQPANRSMKPIWIRESDGLEVKILGVVIGLYRKMEEIGKYSADWRPSPRYSDPRGSEPRIPI